MAIKFTIVTIILAFCISPLMAHDEYVKLRSVTVPNGIHIFARNNSTETRTAAVAFPVFVNLKATTPLPIVKVLPGLSRDVLVVELTKKDPGSSYQYRYRYGAVEGDKLTGPLNWLGLPMKANEEEVDELQDSLKESYLKIEKHDEAPFWKEIKKRLSVRSRLTGKGITNDMMKTYSNQINETRFLNIRCEKIGRTEIILAQNGCRQAKRLTLKFNILKNFKPSKELPFVAIIPPLTEKYLLFLEPRNDDACKYKYRFEYTGFHKVKPIEIESPDSLLEKDSRAPKDF